MQKKSKLNVFTFVMLIILSLTFQPAISTYAACPDGISSYWKLDGTAGSPYTDFISDNDGSTGATTEPTAVTGIVNGAQQFDSTADTKLDVSPDSSFSWFQNESFSIEFWIKRDGGTGVGGSTEVAIGRDDGDSDTSLQWWVGIRGNDVNTARFVLGDNDGGNLIGVSGAKVITDNTWHHVVAVRDGDNDENLLYVDGKLDGSDLSPTPTYDSGFDSTTAKLNIGYLNTDPFFRLNGFLDEVALYNKVLSAKEIEEHYNNGQPEDDYCSGGAPFVPFPDDTISLWNLDEGPNPPNDTYEDSFSLDGNDGVGNDNPTAVAGIVNDAQQFDGANSGIDVLPDSSFSWFKNESFSIEFWIKRDGGTGVGGSTEVAIGRDDGDSDTSLQWWVGIRGNDVNTARFVLGDNDGGNIIGVSGAKVITDNTWHHVVAVRDGDNDENLLYVDGKLDGSDLSPTPTYDSGFDSTTAKLNIGYLNTDPFFRLNGFLDEVALYNKVLSAKEIDEHYNNGQPEGIENSRPAPVAAAVATPPNPKETTGVELNGTGSAAGYAAAQITSYLWEQTSGTPVNNFAGTSTDIATFDAPDFVAAGQPLTFQLTVTASDGQSDTTTVDVDVVDNPPVAKAGPDQNVNEGDPVALDGSSSTGTGITFSWTQTVGTQVPLTGADTATPSFTAPPDVAAAGETLTFQLTVTDNLGATSTDTVDVNVADATVALQANAGADQTVAPGATVTLDGSGSTGTNPTYKWAQTAGTPVQLAGDDTATPTFTAPTAADISAAVLDTLTFQLTVTDASGSNTDTVDVIVDDSVGRSSGGGGGGGGCFINSMF